MISVPGATQAHPGQCKDDLIAEVILRLSGENEALSEEVRQLRAALQLFTEWAARISDRQSRIAGGLYGTL